VQTRLQVNVAAVVNAVLLEANVVEQAVGPLEQMRAAPQTIRMMPRSQREFSVTTGRILSTAVNSQR
jgi:hypothetical protein